MGVVLHHVGEQHAGVLSALGMLLADVVKDYAHTILQRVDAVDAATLAARFEPLVAQAARDLAAEGFTGDAVHVERRLDVRYVGQSYELTVPLADDVRDAFDRAHARTYGYANPRRAVEIVTLRVVAVGRTAKPALPRLAPAAAPAVPYAVRDARFDGVAVPTAFFRWTNLSPGDGADGPAVVAGGEATAVVPPGFAFRIDPSGNLVATRTAGR